MSNEDPGYYCGRCRKHFHIDFVTTKNGEKVKTGAGQKLKVTVHCPTCGATIAFLYEEA